MTNYLAKHIVEIRFKPSAHILDKRGAIAEALCGSLFDQWNVSDNRIDFSSKENKNIHAFFSYRNLGLVSVCPNETSYFINEAKTFIKNSWIHFPADKIVRIGIRSTYVIPVMNFTKAFESYKEKFLKLPSSELDKFGGELVDIGFPFNFVSGEDFFNVMTGPMEKTQLKQFFGNVDDLPNAGIYVDVDYFKKDFSSDLKQRNALVLIDIGKDKAMNIASTIASLVNGEK